MNWNQKMNHWMRNGDTGISSKAILSHLTGVHIVGRWGFGHPHDPSDLNRCVKLIEAVPEIKNELHRMKEVSPVWSSLVDQWDELTDLMRKEIIQNNGNCPKTYQRMKEIGC